LAQSLAIRASLSEPRLPAPDDADFEIFDHFRRTCPSVRSTKPFIAATFLCAMLELCTNSLAKKASDHLPLVIDFHLDEHVFNGSNGNSA